MGTWNVNKKWIKNKNMLFFKITKDVQLRWFNYRIVHQIFATNTYLYKFGIADSELCKFCGYNAETLGYLFWKYI